MLFMFLNTMYFIRSEAVVHKYGVITSFLLYYLCPVVTITESMRVAGNYNERTVSCQDRWSYCCQSRG